MRRLVIVTVLASLYAMAGTIRNAAAALLAYLHAASEPVWLDPAGNLAGFAVVPIIASIWPGSIRRAISHQCRPCLVPS